MQKLRDRIAEVLHSYRTRIAVDTSRTIDEIEAIYAPTAPGAPLTDDEWDEIRTSTTGFRTSTDAVLAKRNTAQPAPADGIVSLDAVEMAIAAYLLDEHGWNVGDALFAASKIHARLSPPKTLRERIKDRFEMQKLVSSIWAPTTLTEIVMEEIAKERHEDK